MTPRPIPPSKPSWTSISRLTSAGRRRSILPSAARALRRRQDLFKREELNHTGAHKVNNVLGQIMLALRMGKTHIIAETGAGMHGVATATLCAKFGLPCIVYMGSVDVERQKPNVLRMKILGAEVRAVEFGFQDAQGCDERGTARLGRQCARHVLLHRHGGGAAPLPGNGARFPVDHRPRDARADA